jgi:hypothetical protein
MDEPQNARLVEHRLLLVRVIGPLLALPFQELKFPREPAKGWPWDREPGGIMTALTEFWLLEQLARRGKQTERRGKGSSASDP